MVSASCKLNPISSKIDKILFPIFSCWHQHIKKSMNLNCSRIDKFLSFYSGNLLVDVIGLEPTTSSMWTKRSNQLSYTSISVQTKKSPSIWRSMVGIVGLEPTRSQWPKDFKSSASTIPPYPRRLFNNAALFAALYKFGGADGTQTHDLYDANVALYQLSYNP